MNVAVYANPLTSIPYLCVLYPALDTVEEAAEKALGQELIPYAIVDYDTLPQDAKYTFNALTVDLSGAEPSYGFDMGLALTTAIGANNSYWQMQYLDGLSELGASQIDVDIALSTPAGDRTAIQQTLVEFVNEISIQKQAVSWSLQSATTGEELNAILNTAFG